MRDTCTSASAWGTHGPNQYVCSGQYRKMPPETWGRDEPAPQRSIPTALMNSEREESTLGLCGKQGAGLTVWMSHAATVRPKLRVAGQSDIACRSSADVVCRNWVNKTEKTIVAAPPPTQPSQVFLGDKRIKGVRPKKNPKIYAKLNNVGETWGDGEF